MRLQLCLKTANSSIIQLDSNDLNFLFTSYKNYLLNFPCIKQSLKTRSSQRFNKMYSYSNKLSALLQVASSITICKDPNTNLRGKNNLFIYSLKETKLVPHWPFLTFKVFKDTHVQCFVCSSGWNQYSTWISCSVGQPRCCDRSAEPRPTLV